MIVFFIILTTVLLIIIYRLGGFKHFQSPFKKVDKYPPQMYPCRICREMISVKEKTCQYCGAETRVSPEENKDFNIDEYAPYVEYTVNLLELPDVETIPQGDKTDITVCFTGFHEVDRDRLKELSAKLGLIPRTGICKNLKLLVCGDKPGPSKIMKAQDIGTEIINFAVFSERYL